MLFARFARTVIQSGRLTIIDARRPPACGRRRGRSCRDDAIARQGIALPAGDQSLSLSRRSLHGRQADDRAGQPARLPEHLRRQLRPRLRAAVQTRAQRYRQGAAASASAQSGAPRAGPCRAPLRPVGPTVRSLPGLRPPVLLRLFQHRHHDIERAQLDKKRHLAAKLLLAPGQRVLDIGSGWGGLALYLAEVGGCEVLGITLSEEQLKSQPAACRARRHGGSGAVRAPRLSRAGRPLRSDRLGRHVRARRPQALSASSSPRSASC